MPPSIPRHVLLFDIDGTLVSTGGAGRAAMQEALAAEFRLPVVREDVPMSGRTDRGIMRDLFRAHDIADTPENLAQLKQAYLRRLPECLTQREGLSLPGVAALVPRLAERSDVALGLLTGNLRLGAQLKLGHFALGEFFSFGAFGDEHLDRDCVACEALAIVRQRYGHGIATQDIWIIGDTPLDVRCARSINARCVAVTTGIHDRHELSAESPDLLVDALEAAEIESLWR